MQPEKKSEDVQKEFDPRKKEFPGTYLGSAPYAAIGPHPIRAVDRHFYSS